MSKKNATINAIVIAFIFLFTAGCSDMENQFTADFPGNSGIVKSATLESNYSLFFEKEQFIREIEKPEIISKQIGTTDILYWEDCFIMYIKSGNEMENYVSSAILKVDGFEVLKTSDFSNSEKIYEVELCDLTENSVLEVEIRGTPDSFLEIWIEGILKTQGTFTDCRDNKEYSWVKINNQYWMSENLAYLPSVSPSNDGSFDSPFYYVYDYQGIEVSEAKSSYNYNTYGVLYNWIAASSDCPCNWHLPTVEEWDQLKTFLGGESVAGGKIKEVGETHWLPPNIGATNEVGFNGLPGGVRFPDDSNIATGFYGIGTNMYFWSGTELDETKAIRQFVLNYWIELAPYPRGKIMDIVLDALRIKLTY